jgi:hypothetical protein
LIAAGKKTVEGGIAKLVDRHAQLTPLIRTHVIMEFSFMLSATALWTKCYKALTLDGRWRQLNDFD